jgi:hypothetical protein
MLKTTMPKSFVHAVPKTAAPENEVVINCIDIREQNLRKSADQHTDVINDCIDNLCLS